MTAPAGRRYQFPPLERRGILLGLRPAALAVVILGASAAVISLRAVPAPAGPVGALAVLAASLGGAVWPIAGQVPVQWLPTVATWALRRRATPTLTERPALGTVEAAPPRHREATAPSGLRLGALAAVPGEEAVGVVEDLLARRWAAVIPVRGPALTLLGRDDQERRVAAWGAVLAGVARERSAVRRVQWVECCGPADPTALRAAAVAAPGMPAARRSYQGLVASESPSLLEHHCYLVVSVQGRRRVGARPAASAALATLLRREVRLVRAQLHSGEVATEAPLAPGPLASSLRAFCDPTRSPVEVAVEERSGSAWPVAVEEHWGAVRVDGSWQATYWVAEWPRTPVAPDVLGALLASAGPQVVSVTMAPVPMVQALRQVQSARTAALADEALRTRAGFLATTQRQREAEGVRQREAELADGHADYRYSGYVTVSAESREALEARCAEVEQAAGRAQLVLRRLYGRQAEARTWTLPIGRGLS